MNTYVIFRRNAWSSKEEVEAAGERSNKVAEEMAADVKWIRTYMLAEESGSIGSVCIFQGTSEDKVREHAACASIPVDGVVLVGDTVIISPDPGTVP